MGEELPELEADLAADRPVDALERHPRLPLHVRYGQPPEAVGVVGIVEQHLAQRVAPGVVAPVVGRGLVRRRDFRKRGAICVVEMGEDHRGDVHPLLLLAPPSPQLGKTLGEPQRPHAAEGEMTKAVGAFVLDDAGVVAGIEHGSGMGADDGREADPGRLLDLLDAERLGEHSLRPDGEIVDDESLDHTARAPPEVALKQADHRLELVENELCFAIGDVREKGKVA